jgi:hypothetical protein
MSYSILGYMCYMDFCYPKEEKFPKGKGNVDSHESHLCRREFTLPAKVRWEEIYIPWNKKA